MTRSGGDFQPSPLKCLFTANQCWTSFLDAGGLCDIEVEAVTKMLACGTRILGIKEFIDRNLNPQKIKKKPKNGCLFNTACVP
ncbi:IS1294 transposase [Escherichia coli]|nr:IS1294 transposase [Escherichia coli]